MEQHALPRVEGRVVARRAAVLLSGPYSCHTQRLLIRGVESERLLPAANTLFRPRKEENERSGLESALVSSPSLTVLHLPN